MSKKLLFIFIFFAIILINNFCFAFSTDIPKSDVTPPTNDLTQYFSAIIDNDNTFVNNDYNRFLVFQIHDSSYNYDSLCIFSYHDYCDVYFTTNGFYFTFGHEVNDIPSGQRPVRYYEFTNYNTPTYLTMGIQDGSTAYVYETVFYVTNVTFTSLQNSPFIYCNDTYNFINGNDTVSTTSANYFVATVTDTNNDVIFEVTDSTSGGGDSGGGSGGDSGGGSSGSSTDYSNVLAHIDSQVTSTNTIIDGIDTTVTDIQDTLNDTYNLTENIDNSVSDIKDYLIGYNNDISNTIMSTSETTQNMISAQTQQQQSNFNTITNTTTYNSSDVVIDTSFNTIQDVNGVDNFIVRVYNIIYGFFNDLDTSLVVNITIPVPFTDKSFVLSTSSLQNFYAEHTSLSNLITVSWYFVFGIYIFRLAYKFWLSSVTGSVFRDTEGFTADLDSDNLVKSLFL